jgi:CubicO group peptidase (beta-lactamase class C family)
MPNSAPAPRLEAAPKSFGSAHDGRMNDVVHGHCDNRFDKVAEALADEIAKGEELGASIALDIDGELVVEIWGGPHLLSHTSGVSGWEPPFGIEDIYDWEKATSHLARQAPWWPPGTASGYHVVNWSPDRRGDPADYR